MSVLQGLGIFIVLTLLAYAVYKVGSLIDVISAKIKGEEREPPPERIPAQEGGSKNWTSPIAQSVAGDEN